MAVFMQVENYIKGDQLILSNEEECKHLHYVLRDFASLLQIIGRLSHLFIGIRIFLLAITRNFLLQFHEIFCYRRSFSRQNPCRK